MRIRSNGNYLSRGVEYHYINDYNGLLEENKNIVESKPKKESKTDWLSRFMLEHKINKIKRELKIKK